MGKGGGGMDRDKIRDMIFIYIGLVILIGIAMVVGVRNKEQIRLIGDRVACIEQKIDAK